MDSFQKLCQKESTKIVILIVIFIEMFKID